MIVLIALGIAGARPAHAQLAAPPRAVARPRALSPSFWVAVGVTGAALTTAIVLDRAALADLDAYQRRPSADLRERGETKALVSDVSFGVAGLAAAVAVVVLVIDCSASRSPTLTAQGIGLAF